MDMEFSVCNVNHKDASRAHLCNIGEIKPELYKQPSLEEKCAEREPETAGSLHFSLIYSQEDRTLTVRVIDACNLPAKDFSGTSDPYVKIYLLPDRKRKFQTKVHRKNLNPTFNEEFAFTEVPFLELGSRTLQLAVYDFDRFSRHDLIGQVVVKNLNGDLSTCKEKDYTMDILCINQEKVDLGELMFSLCYLPTAGRLTVTIIKARNLKAMDITGSSDPYVKVVLVCQGKRIKKKKTTVKKSTLNPVYNEALVFDIPAENIDECGVLVQVKDYDKVGSNEIVGYSGSGMTCLGQGRDHWLEMLDSPRKPIAHWYQLLEHQPAGLSSAHNTPRKLSSCFYAGNNG
ncbi:PREDICTED: synaptotagmin-6-like [Priapulus caudatus]|uniref:Synaptotagmin-6-like n=1 Tax=Priapulus caudatus TaxID=37621 RepID=A0ABM1DYM7_PRICU|nr:PREDICTED: synaptotagmin-6-like [Priapulus caudatus]